MMHAVGDLINRGFIINRPSSEPGRTFIVTGLQRSGTSLVASILLNAGLFTATVLPLATAFIISG